MIIVAICVVGAIALVGGIILVVWCCRRHELDLEYKKPERKVRLSIRSSLMK